MANEMELAGTSKQTEAKPLMYNSKWVDSKVLSNNLN